MKPEASPLDDTEPQGPNVATDTKMFSKVQEASTRES